MKNLTLAFAGLALLMTSFSVPEARAAILGVYDNASELPTVKFVAQARRSIDIEIYEMTDPVFRKTLRTALKNKIRVRIVKEPEPFNGTCFYFLPPQASESPDCLDQKKLMGEIVQAGGTAVPYNKAAFCPQWMQGKCLEHGKMIIIDAGTPAQTALVSTGNFNGSNFCDPYANTGVCNRDYTVITADPEIVNTLSAIFQKDLAGQPYDPRTLMSQSAKTKLTVSPFSSEPLVVFIRSAKSSVMIQNQYLREKYINQALIDVARAGVKVYVNVSSICAFGPPKPEYMDPNIPNSTAAIYTAFDQAGIQTRMFSGAQSVGGKIGYLHAKAIVVDGKYAWVGSVNGSAPATSANREFGVFFNEPAMVNHLATIMRYDFGDPRGESWQESAKCLRDPPRPGNDNKD